MLIRTGKQLAKGSVAQVLPEVPVVNQPALVRRARISPAMLKRHRRTLSSTNTVYQACSIRFWYSGKMASLTDQLKELAKLRQKGLLTEDEFKSAKAKLLASDSGGWKQLSKFKTSIPQSTTRQESQKVEPAAPHSSTSKPSLSREVQPKVLWGILVGSGLLFATHYFWTFSQHEEACLSGDAKSCEEACVALLPKSQSSCVNLGKLYLRGNGVKIDTEKAQQLFEQACDAGLAEGCFESGRARYAAALPTGVGYQGAAEAFMLACDAGLGAGCLRLGRMFQLGEGVSRDSSKAKTSYHSACVVGDLEGCLLLAEHEFGAAAYSRAIENYSKACDLGPSPIFKINGESEACFKAGSMYVQGYGEVERSMKRAGLFLEPLCAEGHMKACYVAGMNLKSEAAESFLDRVCDSESGIQSQLGEPLTKTEYAKACYALANRGLTKKKLSEKADAASLDALGKACDNGLVDACKRFVGFYEQPHWLSYGIPRDLSEVYRYRMKACQLGDGWDCYQAGVQHHYATHADFIEKDGRKAASAFELSCQHIGSTGCFEAGEAFYTGKGVGVDYKKARAYFTKYCTSKHEETEENRGFTCYKLAYMQEYGQGGRIDLKNSNENYIKACRLGIQSACDRILHF